MISGTTLLFALLGGLLPALFWLWFWLREDTIHPEPRSLIVSAFVLGMAVAPLAIIPQKFIVGYFGAGTIATLVLWALVEEIFKFGAAWIATFHRKAFQVPIDPMMYLITAALGFSATENVLFLLTPLANGSIAEAFTTGGLRFIGASLVHVCSSALIGLFIALAFYGSKERRRFYRLAGIFFAVTLHTLFNFFILQGQGNQTFAVFSLLWLAVVSLLLVFEKVKTISP